MTKSSRLTYDEHKAAEAAFQGLPLDPAWTNGAQAIYHGIREVMLARSLDCVGTATALDGCLHDCEPILS